MLNEAMEGPPQSEQTPDSKMTQAPEGVTQTPFQEVMESEGGRQEERERQKEAGSEEHNRERQQRQEKNPALKAQESVIGIITGALKSERSFHRSDLSEDEMRLLSRMSSEVRRAQRDNPDAKINFDLSKNPEAYRTWSGLVNRMAEERLKKPPSNPAPETPELPTDPQQAKAKQIKGYFTGISEAARKGAKEKIKEYDRRIRAAEAGRPLKQGDTVEQLQRDFRAFAKQDWDPSMKFEE